MQFRYLLGSAAALLITSGASAADVVVVADEMEPVEYVRVCDAFGAGYFYIPGTETCLRLSGFVRTDVSFGSGKDSYSSLVRGRLNVHTQTDSELGVLQTHVRLQGDAKRDDEGAIGDGAAVVDQAYAEIGGLLFGYTENTWTMSKNGGNSGFGSHSDGGLSYGYGQANQITYNFSDDNVFAAISVNDDGDDKSFTPDFTGRIGAVIGGATVYAAAGYDQSLDNFGAKLGLNASIGEAGSLIVQGFYANGETDYGANNEPIGDPEDVSSTPRWSIMGSYQHKLAANLTSSIGGQYSGDYYEKGGDYKTDVSSWAVEAALIWNPVDNIEVRGEIRYTTFDPGTVASEETTSATTGLFRLQRNF